MITTLIKNPLRTASFLAGALAGSQVPYLPKTYETYLGIQRDNSEVLLDKYNEILEKRNSEEIRILAKEERGSLQNITGKLKNLENSSLAGRLGTMVLDPKGTYRTIKHYNLGLDIANWKETLGYGLAMGLIVLGLYEFGVRRPIKKLFSKQKLKVLT